MRFLFIHQNFPGQFLHVSVALAKQGHQVYALGEAKNLQGRPLPHPAIKRFGYEIKLPITTKHPYLRNFEAHTLRGQAIVRSASDLHKKFGFVPDVVVAHPGWGEALFLKDIYPQARHILFCEFFYRDKGADVGFDPDEKVTVDDRLRLRVRNATQLIGLEYADAFVSPTYWQRSLFPEAVRPLIKVIHEGIDTQVVKPDAEASFSFGGLTLTAQDEVVTYVARNLEPYRGFAVLMKMLPDLLERRPLAQVVIIGGDDVSYGQPAPGGVSWRAHLFEPLRERIDVSRVHFLGKIPYAHYLKLLQVSSAHLYLTYPFVLSWSLLEAMAAECLVIASSTPPVLECVQHRKNGLLCGFFDVDAWVKTTVDALAKRDKMRGLRRQARQMVVKQFDLATVCLPQYVQFLTDMGQRR